MLIECQWVNSINLISEEDWYKCFEKDNILHSYALQRAIEKSKIVNNFYYLIIKVNKKVKGIICCFEMEYSISDISANLVQRIVYKVRKIYKNFLQFKLLVAGSPISTCSDMLGIPALNHKKNL